MITNMVTSKQYVGMTSNLKRRWKQHHVADGTSRYLHLSIKKYGIDNFIFTHLADAFDLDCAQFIEKLLIKAIGTKAPFGYNLTDGGEGSSGYVCSPETKLKMRISQTGKKMSAESSVKKRIAMMGNQNGVGRQHSAEHKAKIAESGKGRCHTKASKEKMRIKALGRKHSTNTILKMTGRKASPETIEKLRLSHIGKKLTPKSIAKRTATLAINKARQSSQKETA